MLCSRACRPLIRHVGRRARPISDLGLRARLPPDSQPQFDSEDDVPRVSDQEWEIRTGRAIFALQNTFPHFFDTGLVTSVDTETGTPSSMSIIGDVMKLPIQLDAPTTSFLPGKRPSHHEPIYSPKIRLSYTPPVALPAPFPKTISIEGLPLYIASSTFVRHTLKALYTDLRVEIDKFVVQTRGSGHPPPGFFTGSTDGRDFATVLAHPHRELNDLSGQIESNQWDGEFPGDHWDLHGERKRRISRDKCVLIGLKVLGTARVSGAANKWEVTSTYTFSPLSGLILTHVINSIQPAPHQAVYDSLRLSLGKVFGWEGDAPTGLPRPANVHPTPAACRADWRGHEDGSKKA